ncbi:hypothetical protein [Rhizobium sophoriradicis]|uniref:XRE family transcriptional regulator n=1 Tax=Rhizobium sophoriradicis TaxID=1535245 RepID=A0A2A5KKR0_9HYPH|nr:hypothetical protein [Rhizobium sophoriradicis]PCK77541.1 hypothetical protein CPT34_29575 [Rhizobium sophoriradicis]
MVPIKGTFVQARNAKVRDDYVIAISDALRHELGSSAPAIKTIMRWTGASNRAAKYWLAGERGPGGWHLIQLARNSDAVFHAFLMMAGRDAFEVSIEVNAARASLARADAILEALGPRH